MIIVMIHDPGYEMNSTYSERCCGKMPKIHTIRVPTVPMTDRIIGTADHPIPRRAPGKRSMMPQRKYGTVVIDRISIPQRITSGSPV